MKLNTILNPAAGTTLNEHQSKQLLKQFNIPVVEERLADDADQAVAAAREFGYPVVLKGLGAELHHKTEHGLVHLQLNDDRAVRRAARQIATDAGDRLTSLLVQPQVTGRRELMAGLFQDSQFGPVVVFGLGGVQAEALDDVAMALAPLTAADAHGMLARIRAQKLLSDFRGEKAVPIQSLVQVLLGLSRLAQAHPEIAEIDINPMLVSPGGSLCAVDALVILKPPAPETVQPAPVPPETIGALFYPRAIAFVGASSQMTKWGYMLAVNTIAGGYKGKLYMVNPKGGRIAGHKAYPGMADIPEPVDLAVVTIPAAKVLDLIPQCQAKGIRYMVLITSGFGETGSSGKRLESQLVMAARKAGILILGPNTMGIANPHVSLYCTGTTVSPLAGGTAMVAQSGNMGTQLLAFAERQGIGIRGFAGSGNEAMITIEDYLEGFENDPLTRTVLLYVESVKNGRRFFESARRICRHKPVVLLKGGQSRAGLRAAASHTGALMSDSRVFNAMCRQTGVVKVEQPMELLDLAAAFSSLPLPRGPRVAIMTLGGGWGVVTADLCQHHGLQVPELDENIIKEIDKILPPYWSRANPVDMVGENDPTVPLKIMEALMAWKGCDAVINLGVLGRRIFLQRLSKAARASDPDISQTFLDDMDHLLIRFEDQYIGHIVQLMATHKKPVFGVSLLTDGQEKTLYRVPDSNYKGVFYETPERAVYALSKMVAYDEFLSRQRDAAMLKD